MRTPRGNSRYLKHRMLHLLIILAMVLLMWTGGEALADGAKGDFDADWDVDFWDFMSFIDVYGMDSGDAEWMPDSPTGDFDDDNDVDFWDFMSFIDVYGTTIPAYSLTVNNGTGDGDYAEGTVVDITADPAPTGQVI